MAGTIFEKLTDTRLFTGAHKHRFDRGPGPPGRACALSVLHGESVLYGAFVWVCMALNTPKRRFRARADGTGRGVNGRDVIAKGGGSHYTPGATVTDIGHTMRPAPSRALVQPRSGTHS